MEELFLKFKSMTSKSQGSNLIVVPSLALFQCLPLVYGQFIFLFWDLELEPENGSGGMGIQILSSEKERGGGGSCYQS